MFKLDSVNSGPMISLLATFLSALMDLLTAFHLFGFTENQRTAVIAVTTAAVFLGLYLYAILHQQAAKIKMMGYRPPTTTSVTGGGVGQAR